MPRIYKRNCNICGKYYEGIGQYFCGVKCSEKYRKEKAKKGEWPGVFSKGHIPWSKGKTKKEFSQLARPNNKFSELARQKSRIAASILMKGNKYTVGRPPWNKGKKVPAMTGENNPAKRPEVRRILSQQKIGKNNPMYGRKREKHPNWQGGTSFGPYTVDWTNTLKKAIRERDKYICQVCNSYGDVVHHIDYNKKNCNPNNLITLCVKCHSKTNFNREKWKKYFAQIVKVKIAN